MKKPNLLIALASAAIASLFLTSCGAGFDAPTRHIKQVTDGVEADLGLVKVRNVVIVAQPDGSGVLVGTFVNNGEDAEIVKSISINGTLATISGSIIVSKNSPVIFAGDSSNASAVVTLLNSKIGKRVPISITFSSVGTVNFTALVREKAGEFKDVVLKTPVLCEDPKAPTCTPAP
ncbi:unannotated protein [freshwater metagenome]|uniref:Unannotated protein n=1 Tax=freshwater metagenome TaxID=449393 RepID=A0A6J6G3J3_9ZZZZ|nr:hypothetical protein [Actinomycetota bacterium]